MLIKTKHGQVFSLGGTIAAIMSEKVWDKLLAGQKLCVLEPDDVRWTLICEGHPIDIVRSDTAEKAVEAFVKRNPAFMAACQVRLRGNTPAAKWGVRSGFPNYLECTPEQRTAHYKAGRTDSKKIAAFYRHLVQKHARNVLAEEISRHSTKWEGKDN